MATLTSKLIVELIDRASAPSRAIAGAVNRLTAMQSRNTAALASAQTQMLGAVAVAYGLAKSIGAPIKAAADFETTLFNIKQKSGVTGDALKALGVQIRGIADATNSLPDETAKTFDALMGLGLGGKTDAENVEAALKLLPAINKTAVAFQASSADIMASGQAVFANFKVPAEQVIKAFDAMAASGNAGAFELKDMATYFPELSSLGKELGYHGVPAVADMAAALQVVRQGAGDASSAATNLKDIFAQMLSPKLAGNFKKFGIDLRKVMAADRRKKKSPIETIVEQTRKALKAGASLGDLFKNKESLIGMSALLGDMDRYRQIREEALKASGLIEKEYADRIKTADAATVRFKAAVQNLNIELGSNLLPTFTGLINNAIVPLVKKMSEFAKNNPKLTSAVVGLSAGLIGLRIAGFAAAWGLRWMWGGALATGIASMKALGVATKVAGVAMWPMMAGARAVGRATGLVAVSSRGAAKATAAQAAATLTQKQAAFQSALAMQALARQGKVAGLSAAGAAANVRQAGMALAAAQGNMKAASAGLAATAVGARAAAVAMRVLKVAVIGTGVGAVLVGIAAAGIFIYNNWSLVKSLFVGVGEGIMSALQPVMPVVQPVIDGFGWLSDKISGLLGPLDASNESWRAMGVAIGETIGGAITSVIQKIQSFIGWIRDAGKAVGRFLGFGGGAKPPAAAAATVAAPAIAGARAAGGPVRAGSAYLVGENGPEIFRARANGAISNTLDTVRAIKAQAMAGAAKAGGGGGTVTNTVTIHVQAAPGQSPEAIALAVEKQLSSKLNALSRGAYSDGVY